MSDIPYQLAPQIARLQGERENCVAYGNDRRVEQIDRQLADLGVKQEAAEKRAAASESDDAKKVAPKGRRSTQAQTAEGDG